MKPFRVTPNGLELNVRLTPKARHERIGDVQKMADGSVWLKIYVTEPAEDNKANGALIAFLAKSFKIAKSDIEILSGHKDRQKILKITGITDLPGIHGWTQLTLLP